MECKFQIGDPVVCVEELDLIGIVVYEHRGPILDEIYHVRDLREGLCLICSETHIFVYLTEIVLPRQGGRECGFPTDLFRRLITPEQFMDKVVERV
jgi:hypothetical protein